MKDILTKFKGQISLVVIASLAIAIIIGYSDYSRKEGLKQDLDLNGFFVNIQGVKIDTTPSGMFSDKAYDKIVIKIPSIASVNDDQTESGEKKVNQIIDRKKLGDGFKDWLVYVFNPKVAEYYTNHIEIWYRDEKIISLPDQGSWKLSK
jgi:hypothetical protein